MLGTYRRLLARAGESVTLQRLGAPDNSTGKPSVSSSATVTMRLVDTGAAGDTPQNAQRRGIAIVLHADLVGASFAVPPRQGDRLKVGTRVLSVDAVDSASRRIEGVQIAYQLDWSGELG